MRKKDLRQDLFRNKLALSASYIVNNKKRFALIIAMVCVIISGYSVYSINTQKKSDKAMESISTEFNKAEPSIAKLQNTVDKFENEPAGSIAYMYLIYDSYRNNNSKKMDRLINDYFPIFNDPLMKASFFETRANILMNNKNYNKAIKFLDQSLNVGGIYTFNIRFNIAKAWAYIQKEEYSKAAQLLNNIKDNNDATNLERAKINQMIAYISNISQ